MSTRKSFDNEAMLAIGRRIREARGDVTQIEFAETLEVDRATLSNYETGRRLPNADTINRIEYITGVGEGYILTGKRDSYNITVDAMKQYQEEFIKQSQRKPGFYPRWFFSDFELALLRCFRQCSDEDRAQVTRIVAEAFISLKDTLNHAVGDDMPSFEDESYTILTEALKRGDFEQGLDVEQVLWALVGKLPFFGPEQTEGAQ